MTKILRGLILAGAMLLASGCAHQILVSPNPSASTASGTKLPIDVGLYVSDSFRNYQYSESKLGDTWQYNNLGQASVQQIRAGLEQRFRSVAMLQSRSLAQVNPAPVVVIEPEVASFSFDIPFTKFQVYPATIRYKVTVLGPGGDTLYTNIVNGVGDTSGSPGFDFSANPARSATKAVEIGIDSLLNELVKSPAIQKLLQGVEKGNTATPARIL